VENEDWKGKNGILLFVEFLKGHYEFNLREEEKEK
jgi:hypothetical protein